MKEIEDAVKNLESRLKIHDGFFDALFDEDDWSFVIKSHALIESCATELLTNAIGRVELEDIFSHLPLGDKKVGKIKYMQSLSLIEMSEVRFIEAFSTLRNMLVHNVQNINFDFEKYYQQLNKDNKRNFVNNFGIHLDMKGNLEKNVEEKQRFLESPKTFIWYGLKWVIAIMALKSEVHFLKNEAEYFKKEVTDFKNKIDIEKAKVHTNLLGPISQ
jgi:hypothetical protein